MKAINGTCTNFGYFDGDSENSYAGKVCVLVVHYKFEDDVENVREGNDVDLERLQSSFETKRNCSFRQLQSPKTADLLYNLSSDEKILELFDISEVPSVFLLFILSHGGRDGKIYTDHRNEITNDYEYFYTFQVLESLRTLQKFESTLQLIFFGPCRGEIQDEVHEPQSPSHKINNENSCRVTNYPQKDNFICVFSTVETTRAKRDEKNGTALVLATCEILDGLQQDTELEIVLTYIQNKIHENSSGVSQSPEIKFSPFREFTVAKSPDLNIEEVGKSEHFFSWLSSSNLPVRGRWAAIVCDDENDNVKNVEKTFRETLDFETCIFSNSVANLESLSRKAWDDEETDVGCITICYFAKLSVNTDSEVCVKVEGNEISVGNLVQKFIGPNNEKWIGRPKLFFFVHQCVSSDHINNRQRTLSISATNHSGWFVFIMPNEGADLKLAEILEDPQLRRGKSLQELSIGVLRQEKNKCAKSGARPQIATTLPHLLDFPEWPRRFVHPNFIVTTRASENEEEQNERKLTFRQLKSAFLRELESDVYCVWVVSAPPGMGKSTFFCEMEHHLRKELRDKVLFRIQMIEQYEYLDMDDASTTEGLLQNAKQLFLQSDIGKIIDEKRAVVFLDGFDEVCPDFRKKVLALIKEMVDLKIPLWIATRPQEEEVILVALKGVPTRKVEIAPFDKTMQMELLKLTSIKRDNECSSLLEEFEKVGAWDILKNPFHLTLIANQAIGDDTNLYAIYRNVVEKKVKEALTQKESYDKSSKLFNSKVKKRIKLLQTFAKQFLLGTSVLDLKGEKIIEINNTGIATIRGSKNFRFVHQTLAEFLLAQYFVTDIAENETSSVPMFELANLRQCRVFIDAFVSHPENSGSDKIESFIKTNVSKQFVELVVSESLNGLFHLAKPFIVFSEEDKSEEALYIEDGFYILESACQSSETIGQDLLKMKLLDQIVDRRSERVWNLIQQVARNNFCDLFGDFLVYCPDLREVLHSRRNAYITLTTVERGNDRMLEMLLKNGLDANVSKNNKTALQAAIVAGNVECVRILISHGAKLNPSPRDSWKRDMVLTPLHIAACNESVEICRSLVDNGADLAAIVALGGWSAFHFACSSGSIDNVKYFISLDFYDINAKTTHGRTPLILSAEGDHQELVQLFLRQDGVDLLAADKDGWNAMHYAARYAGLQTVKLLVQNDSKLLECRTKHGWRPIELSLMNPNSAVRQYLIQENTDLTVTKDGWNLLHWASHNGDFEFARFLCSKIDLNLTNDLGRTALHLAAEMGHIEVVKLLIEKGANSRVTDKFGMLASHLVSSEECAKFLNDFCGELLPKPSLPHTEKSVYDSSNSDVSVSKYVFSVLSLRGYLRAKESSDNE